MKQRIPFLHNEGTFKICRTEIFFRVIISLPKLNNGKTFFPHVNSSSLVDNLIYFEKEMWADHTKILKERFNYLSDGIIFSILSFSTTTGEPYDP